MAFEQLFILLVQSNKVVCWNVLDKISKHHGYVEFASDLCGTLKRQQCGSLEYKI